jgi:hypothetical protein
MLRRRELTPSVPITRNRGAKSTIESTIDRAGVVA